MRYLYLSLCLPSLSLRYKDTNKALKAKDSKPPEPTKGDEPESLAEKNRPWRPLSTTDTRDIITRSFQNVNGFIIDSARARNETRWWKGHNESIGECDYGELEHDGREGLIASLNFTENDVFVDLGCGVGKINAHVYLRTNIKESIGIDILSERILMAEKAKAQMIHTIQQTRAPPQEDVAAMVDGIQFITGNILQEEKYNKATVALICSACFHSELTNQLFKRLNSLPLVTRMVSLRDFDENLVKNSAWKFVKQERLHTSWTKSAGSSFNIYAREKPQPVALPKESTEVMQEELNSLTEVCVRKNTANSTDQLGCSGKKEENGKERTETCQTLTEVCQREDGAKEEREEREERDEKEQKEEREDKEEKEEKEEERKKEKPDENKDGKTEENCQILTEMSQRQDASSKAAGDSPRDEQEEKETEKDEENEKSKERGEKPENIDQHESNSDSDAPKHESDS